MAVTIRGIKLKAISITPSPDHGDDKINTTYQLISTADKVLAEQSVGGYNGMKIAASPQALKALDEFLKLYRDDIETALGFTTE